MTERRDALPSVGDAAAETFPAPIEIRDDALSAWPARALHAALERDGPPPEAGDPLPLFWRWLYFLDAEPPSRLGRDGHPAKGIGLIPDLGLPRRMWAGGRIERRRPLLLGRPARLTSRVASIARKTGRTGPLAFVTLRHETSDADGVVEVEEQDLVYREDPRVASGKTQPTPSAARNAATREAPQEAAWRRERRADTTLLFRYSALTFNGHRIHYDIAYATEVEDYAGLVVHGPLFATLMLELARDETGCADVREFWFRALAPVTHDAPFAVCGRPTPTGALLWIERDDGAVAMRGEARFA